VSLSHRQQFHKAGALAPREKIKRALHLCTSLAATSVPAETLPEQRKPAGSRPPPPKTRRAIEPAPNRRQSPDKLPIVSAHPSAV
jgi:hypothetical protein